MIVTAQNAVFSDKEITNFIAFSCTLKRIHTRLIKEGYIIRSGQILKSCNKAMEMVK